jgi:predicted chitinase
MNMYLGDTRLLIEVGRERGLLRNEMAYVLATVRHETAGTMKPVRENMNYRAERILEVFGSKHSAKVTRAEAQKLAGNPQALAERVYGLGNPVKAKELGNISKGDGFKYRGGGYDQRTGRNNYRRVGLENDPDQIVEPKEAARAMIDDMIAGNYTGMKLSDFITLTKSDFVGARRVINVQDKAATIASIAKEYDKALLAEGYGVDQVVMAKVAEIVPDPAQEKPLAKTKRFWAWFGSGGGAALMPFVDWKVQAMIVALLVLIAVVSILTMPQARAKFQKWIEAL